MDLSQLYGAASVLIVIALVMAFTMVLNLPKRYAPLAAILVGIAWNVAVGRPLGYSPYEASLIGIVAGLSAAGLYDVGKQPVITAKARFLRK